MDPTRNPFAPGAGNQPPELAGRGAILETARVALRRAAQGRHAKSFMLVGLRGVGKTVLLNRIRQLADELRQHAYIIESPEDKSLAELLVPILRRILLELSRDKAASHAVQRGLRILVGFAKRLKVKYGDIEVGLDIEPEPGIGDSGDFEADLSDVLVAVAEAAKSRKTVVALLIDELQHVGEKELSALIMAVHRVSQEQLPLILIGAGLPQLVCTMRRSKSYAERLFDFPQVGSLSRQDAVSAIREPIGNEGEKIAKAAIDRIVEASKGYPYFLQAWGYHSWNAAARSPISARDVTSAETKVLENLDSSFFRVRFDRLTPSEKRYLRAMAELGPGPHRSGRVSEELGITVNSAAPTRGSLIKKGVIHNPSHGDTAFTVPLFDEFMKRQMPSFQA